MSEAKPAKITGLLTVALVEGEDGTETVQVGWEFAEGTTDSGQMRLIRYLFSKGLSCFEDRERKAEQEATLGKMLDAERLRRIVEPPKGNGRLRRLMGNN